MKSLFLSIIFLLTFGTFQNANSQNSGDRALEKLVKNLTKNANTDLEKVENFHDWIANNITYDTKAYFSGNRGKQNYETTLKSKKSLCGGYADLFQKMCESANIPCEKVRGYSRGYGFALFDEENPKDGNHVWNAVKINGKWSLVDVTWDSGYMEGRKFNQRFSRGYFLRSPAEMIFTHYPLDSDWQLLKEPINPYEFSKLPYLNSRFFEEGFSLVSFPKRITEINNQEPFQLFLEMPKTKLVNALVVDPKGNVCRECVWVNRNGNKAEINLIFPKKGEWTVHLMQRNFEDEKFNACGKIGFIVKKANERKFPLAYLDFQKNKCKLNSPLNESLTAGKETNFSLVLPGYKKAAFLINKKWVQLEKKSGEVFEGKIVVPRGIKELSLYVGKDAKSNELQSLIRWQVQ